MRKIRTRIAPSPTGYLHVGTARTAIFNYLFTKKMKGALILRIEDTDKARSEKKYEKDILEGLVWLGIEPDESYRQSERLEIYERYLHRLLEEKKAFWCAHDKETLEQEAMARKTAGKSPRHRCDARHERQTTGAVIRLATPETQTVCFEDVVRGRICFETEVLGDISIAKDIHTPLYNFAVAIDDYEMNISHVIRGEDHIPNTPKQILIQRALGFPEPQWVHMALTLSNDRSKLSKRHGATALHEYRREGYLPEAVVNYLALLGWNPGNNQELFGRKELINVFSLERVQKSNAVFDSEKLTWMNGEYIRQSPIDVLFLHAKPFLPNGGKPLLKKQLIQIVALEQPRIKKLSELTEDTRFFFKRPDYNANLLRWKGKEDFVDIIRHLRYIKTLFEKNFKRALQESIMMYAETQGRGDVLWPLRAALSGREASPGPIEIIKIFGKKESLERIATAIKKIKDV